MPITWKNVNQVGSTGSGLGSNALTGINRAADNFNTALQNIAERDKREKEKAGQRSLAAFQQGIINQDQLGPLDISQLGPEANPLAAVTMYLADEQRRLGNTETNADIEATKAGTAKTIQDTANSIIQTQNDTLRANTGSRLADSNIARNGVLNRSSQLQDRVTNYGFDRRVQADKASDVQADVDAVRGSTGFIRDENFKDSLILDNLLTEQNVNPDGTPFDSNLHSQGTIDNTLKYLQDQIASRQQSRNALFRQNPATDDVGSFEAAVAAGLKNNAVVSRDPELFDDEGIESSVKSVVETLNKDPELKKLGISVEPRHVLEVLSGDNGPESSWYDESFNASKFETALKNLIRREDEIRYDEQKYLELYNNLSSAGIEAELSARDLAKKIATGRTPRPDNPRQAHGS